jgi:hypothetical protein
VTEMNRREMIEENLRRKAELADEIEERERRYEPLVREKPRPSPPQRTDTMPEQNSWDAWDRWAKAHVDAGTAVLARVIGERVGEIHRGINKELAELREELAALRIERQIERAAKVVDLPSFLRRKEHAA